MYFCYESAMYYSYVIKFQVISRMQSNDQPAFSPAALSHSFSLTKQQSRDWVQSARPVNTICHSRWWWLDSADRVQNGGILVDPGLPRYSSKSIVDRDER